MNYNIEVKDFNTVLGTKVKMAVRTTTTDSMVIQAIMHCDEYQAQKYKHLLKDNDVIIDIGSHIGSWAVLLATYNPKFKVYAYEALPENYEMILRQIELNKLANLEAYNFAVSDCSEGNFTICYREQESEFGKQHRFIGSSMGDGANKIEVKQISLNDILAKFDHIRMLKIDAEGAECIAFPKLSKAELDKVDIFVGEFHSLGMTYEQFWSMFSELFVDRSIPPQFENIRDFTFVNKRLL